MKATLVRLAALACGLVIIGTPLALADPLDGRGWLAILLAFAGAMLVTIVFLALRRFPASREATLAVSGKRFVAYPSVWAQGFHCLGATYIGACALLVFARAWAVVAVVAAGGLLFWRRPVTELNADGVVVRDVVGAKRAAWDEAFHPHGVKRAAWDEAFHPHGAKRAAWDEAEKLSVPYWAMDCDREFVAFAIRYYRDRPEDRPAIGTEAELGRLQAAFSDSGRSGQPSPGDGDRRRAAGRVS
ncbi:MAG TPA: hypothetical protein VF062_02595 [Candidatus Limnocylindrales bacterium]